MALTLSSNLSIQIKGESIHIAKTSSLSKNDFNGLVYRSILKEYNLSKSTCLIFEHIIKEVKERNSISTTSKSEDIQIKVQDILSKVDVTSRTTIYKALLSLQQVGFITKLDKPDVYSVKDHFLNNYSELHITEEFTRR